MEGENRGTCPFCRSQEAAKEEEWSLEVFSDDSPHIPTNLTMLGNVSAIQSLVKESSGKLLAFLNNQPTVGEFLRSLRMPPWLFVSSETIKAKMTPYLKDQGRYDSIEFLIRGELLVLENKHTNNIKRCPYCDSVVRLPDRASFCSCLVCRETIKEEELSVL